MVDFLGAIKRVAGRVDSAPNVDIANSSVAKTFQNAVSTAERTAPPSSLVADSDTQPRRPVSLVGEGSLDNIRPLIFAEGFSNDTPPTDDGRTQGPRSERSIGAASADTPGVTDANGTSTNTLADSRARTDALERDLRAAQEHEREPDLTTAKNNLAEHLENDYIPRLQQQQTSLGTQLHLASERGQDTTDIKKRYDENAAELERAQGLLDEAKGSPIAAQNDAGVLATDIDPQNPGDQFNIEIEYPGGARANASVSVTEANELGPDGQRMVTVSVEQVAGLGASGSIDGSFASVGGEFIGGELSNYEVSIPAAAYEDVKAGRAPFPNPADLSTLPPNSSVMLTEENFLSGEIEGQFGAFRVGVTEQVSEGSAVGVAVDGDGNVRVLAGPTSAVGEGIEFGIGKTFGENPVSIGGEVTFEFTAELRDSELRFVDIDRNTGQGAYQDFLRTGDVPANGTGVSGGGTIYGREYVMNNAIGGEFNLGPVTIKVGGEGEGTGIEWKTIEYNDGRVEAQVRGSHDGFTHFRDQVFDASGRQISDDNGVVADGLHESAVDAVGTATGTTVPDGATGFTIRMTEEEFQEFKRRAIASLDPWDQQALANGSFVDPNPVARALYESDSYEEWLSHNQTREGGAGGFQDLIARAYVGTRDEGPIDATVSYG